MIFTIHFGVVPPYFWGFPSQIQKKMPFRRGEELPRRDTRLSDAGATVSRAFRVQVPGIPGISLMKVDELAESVSQGDNLNPPSFLVVLIMWC